MYKMHIIEKIRIHSEYIYIAFASLTKIYTLFYSTHSLAVCTVVPMKFIGSTVNNDVAGIVDKQNYWFGYSLFTKKTIHHTPHITNQL